MKTFDLGEAQQLIESYGWQRNPQNDGYVLPMTAVCNITDVRLAEMEHPEDLKQTVLKGLKLIAEQFAAAIYAQQQKVYPVQEEKIQ